MVVQSRAEKSRGGHDWLRERYAWHPENSLTGKALEAVSFTAYPGLEGWAKKADEKAVTALLAEVDAARRANDDAKLLAAIGGMDRLGVNFETGINGVYNLFDRDGFHYCVYGGSKVLKTTDDNIVRGPVRIVKTVDVAAAMPPEAAKAVTRIIGLNMTYDGHIAAAAPGALVVLDRDLNVKAYVTFPEAVDNSICIDEKSGIYVVTSRRMLKVSWNGEKLSTNEKDGGWESGYEWTPDEKVLAGGVDLARFGHHADVNGFGNDPDKLVVIASRQKATRFSLTLAASRDFSGLQAEARHQVAAHRSAAEVQVAADRSAGFADVVVGPQIYLLVFDPAPKRSTMENPLDFVRRLLLGVVPSSRGAGAICGSGPGVFGLNRPGRTLIKKCDFLNEFNIGSIVDAALALWPRLSSSTAWKMIGGLP